MEMDVEENADPDRYAPDAGGEVRLRLDLAYDGGSFHGWARQPGLRTVQGTIEEALAKVTGSGRRQDRQGRGIFSAPAGKEGEVQEGWNPHLVVAGRTDTGVHASRQVCHLDLPADLLASCQGHMEVEPEQALERRLRHVLPDDVVMRSVTRAPDGFDARFSALERTYVYRICDRPGAMDPRLRGFVLEVDGPLDVELMDSCAQAAVGLHDFGSFSTPNPGGTTIRKVLKVGWRRVPRVEGDLESGLVEFTIVADAFAHNMVRSLVNACLRVGAGRQTADWFRGKVETPAREGATGPIAARGLTLEGVAYPPDGELALRAQAIRARRTL